MERENRFLGNGPMEPELLEPKTIYEKVDRDIAEEVFLVMRKGVGRDAMSKIYRAAEVGLSVVVMEDRWDKMSEITNLTTALGNLGYKTTYSSSVGRFKIMWDSPTSCALNKDVVEANKEELWTAKLAREISLENLDRLDMVDVIMKFNERAIEAIKLNLREVRVPFGTNQKFLDLVNSTPGYSCLSEIGEEILVNITYTPPA